MAFLVEVSGHNFPVISGLSLCLVFYHHFSVLQMLVFIRLPSCLFSRFFTVVLKGLCHEMNNFLKVLKIKSVLSVYAPIVLKNFGCLVMEKIKDEVLACFYENTY